jgi:hypothetical protein
MTVIRLCVRVLHPQFDSTGLGFRGTAPPRLTRAIHRTFRWVACCIQRLLLPSRISQFIHLLRLLLHPRQQHLHFIICLCCQLHLLHHLLVQLRRLLLLLFHPRAAAVRKSRIVTLGFPSWRRRSRGRYATPTDPPRHDGTPDRWLQVRRWGLAFVHRSGTPSQTLKVAIRLHR